MMADLIRTSLFCDVNDILAEDEFQILTNMKHTYYDVINADDRSSHAENFLEFVAGTSVEEVALDKTTTPHTGNDVITEQTTSTEVQTQCCHDSVISKETCGDFLSRVMQASKVDLSTFSNVSPGEIFGNVYLQSIVLKNETDVYVNQQSENNTYPGSSSSTNRRPPYSYAASAVTAIYLSGKYCLSIDEIMEHLCKMFDEVRNGNRRIYRKRLSKMLKTHALFQRTTCNRFRVVPGRASRNTFHRQVCTDEQRKKYPKMIFDQFGVPTMLADLGIELKDVGKRQATRERTKAVTDLLKHRKSTVSVEGLSQSAKSGILQMPERPCFVNDSDSEDDEPLSQHTRRNISPVSVGSSTNSESVCSNESSTSFENNYCTAFATGQRFEDNVSNISHNPSVVVPAPRYAVPTPSACIPLRCQEYHIPSVGTFKMVDMYYNGQIIHQLFH